MDAGLASWLVIALALAAANLPFFNERLFGLLPVWGPAAQARAKPAWARLAELLVLYFLVGALARALEASIGNAFTQTWEFYAITACFFLVLAFPGFVLRYLRRPR